MNQTKNKHQLMLVLLVLVTALVGCSSQAAPAAEVQEIANLPVNLEIETVNELRQRDDVFILDVREDFEYDAGHGNDGFAAGHHPQ